MKLAAIIFMLIFSITLISTAINCNTTEPPVDNGIPSLSLADVSCTEAWLNLKTSGLSQSVDLSLYKNGSAILAFSLSSRDTIIYLDSLEPNKTYSIQALLQTPSNFPKASNKISLTTLDTTSNDFTWQTFTFGGNAGSSTFYDCAIINDTLAYAVGSVYLNDPSGQSNSEFFNAVKWNGNEWNLQQLNIDYHEITRTPPLDGIFTFSPKEIWLMAGVPIYGDGEKWDLYHLWDMGFSASTSKAWGINPSNMYFVGAHGSLVHFDNGSWQEIESGTPTDIKDIWGYNDPNTNQPIELCAVSSVFSKGDHKILKIIGNKVDSLEWNTSKRVQTVWTKNGFPIYVGGDGVFENKRGYWKGAKDIPSNYNRSIRGTDLNDIFVCGDFGLLAHYNGMRWKVYNNVIVKDIYYSVAVNKNLIVAVGTDKGRAVITMAKRN